MPESILNWGIELILSLQNLGDWLTGPMNVFTFLGNEDFFLLLFPFLYWCIETQVGIRLGVYLVLNIGLNELIKAGFHDPRPYWFDSRVRLLTGGEFSFGIPSGHAQNGVVIWSGLAAQIRRGWAWGIAVVLASFIGFSRIYLGVHFPTDVFAGWFLGAVVLILAILLEKPVLAWLGRFGMWQKIGFFFALSLVFIFLNGLIIQGVNNSFTVPALWLQNASRVTPEEPIAPLSLIGMITIIASGFGFTSGFIWLETRGGFDTQGTWLVRAGRFVVGIVGVLALRYGLDILFSFAADVSTLGYTLRYIRYGVIGFWIAALAPVIFIQLKLASSKP